MDALDCVCVIHGPAVYDWQYVTNLHGMLRRYFNGSWDMHVLTEPDREVPGHFIRHDLDPWPGAEGPRRGWWNKLQLFTPGRFDRRMLYFDLDTVIVRDISWMRNLDRRKFWAVRDFRHLWRPGWSGMNSSIMLWDPACITDLSRDIAEIDINMLMDRYHGDQDYLNERISPPNLDFFPTDRIQSWRWQVYDGGMDMKTRQYRRPGAGPLVPSNTDVVIFHGRPKPHQIQSDWIQRHWQVPALA